MPPLVGQKGQWQLQSQALGDSVGARSWMSKAGDGRWHPMFVRSSSKRRRLNASGLNIICWLLSQIACREGIGINLAIQDAVAAANRLAPVLAGSAIDDAVLHAVQRRRNLPAVLTQLLLQGIHRFQLEPVFAGGEPRPSLPLRLLSATRLGRRLAALLIGIGFRPEHVDTGCIESQ